MYKPPQNCNRVKSIKNKFENIENQKDQAPALANFSKISVRSNHHLTLLKKTDPFSENSRNSQPIVSNVKTSESGPQCESSRNGHPSLSRQLSDPLKRNIKRTPAFRVDRNSEKALEKPCFQRYETKVRQLNSVKGCENTVEKKTKDFDTIINKCAADILSLNYPELSATNIKSTNCDVSDSLLKENNSFLYSKGVAKDKIDNALEISPNNSRNLPNLVNSPYKTDPQDVKTRGNPSKRPVLIKSKSSHDFQYILSKFSKEAVNDTKKSPTKKYPDLISRPANVINSKNVTNEVNQCNMIQEDTGEDVLLQNIDLSLLYTEPIPKSLRYKNSSESSSGNTESPLFKPKIDSIYTKSTLQLTDTDKKVFLESLKKVLKHDLPVGLTDSLKVALKKPLPDGPAPKKPPRTFKHCVESVLASTLQKNSSFLHVAKEVVEKKNGTKKSGKRSDPKYMLNKLEMALKNNKLRARKQQRVEVSTTSGEDSDDSLLFRSKSCRGLPKPPTNVQESKPDLNVNSNGLSDFLLGDLNCFNTFGCTNSTYERIREPNSSFFVGYDKDPIYAEPIQSLNRTNEINGNNRNSLYYMSTTLIPEDTGQDEAVTSSETSPVQEHKMDGIKEDSDNTLLNRQLSAENSSLSSFTSDLDSNPSPVTDDPHVKIRYLIENFESRRQTLPKVEMPEEDDRQQRCSTPPDSIKRVEALKNSLQKTLDKTFNGDAANQRDSDSEKNEEGKVARMVARFHTFQKSAPKYQQPKINTDTLFYCCLVIEKVHDCAQIKFKFPPNVDIPRDIEHLCFPENPDGPPLEGTSAAQTYTLLITSELGDRTYGYCRRVLPEGSTHCLPLAYCILSKYRAPRFYKRILLELESRHGMQNKFRDELISQFYHKPFPKPGESILINLSSIENRRTRDLSYSNSLEESLDLTTYVQVNKTGEYGSLTNTRKTSIFVSQHDIVENCQTPSYVAYEGNKTELVLTLHSDTRYEDADLKRLHKLPPDILLKIFSSLLLERKVILISSVISELSSCVDSLQSILYPFTWYHTFIPILPESLWDIVDSPTPVVCGVLSADAMTDRHIENGIVVNLDTQSVLVEEGDEMKILSGSMHKVWRQFITLANNTKSREYVYSVYLADAYLYVFICCFKNYKQYVVGGQFLKDELVKNAKTKGIRRFLKMFTETCMFHAFVDAALNNPESLTAFDKKIELYGSDESRIILDKLIDWHR